MTIQQPELTGQMIRYILSAGRDELERQAMREVMVLTYLSLEIQARADQLEAQFDAPTAPEAPFA